MSPELIAPQEFGFKKSRLTKSSDCYALGMVIYETISGKLPFHKDTDYTISLKVVKGERPHRGVWFTDALWGMLEWCWISQPSDRPNIENVLGCLEIASNASGPSLGSYRGAETDDDSDFSDDSFSVPGRASDASITGRDCESLQLIHAIVIADPLFCDFLASAIFGDAHSTLGPGLSVMGTPDNSLKWLFVGHVAT